MVGERESKLLSGNTVAYETENKMMAATLTEEASWISNSAPCIPAIAFTPASPTNSPRYCMQNVAEKARAGGHLVMYE